MAKRFVIATDPLTADQEKALKDVLDSAIWWHWLPNFWLVKDGSESLTAGEIRDAVKRISPIARTFVVEVDSITWAALTKKDSKKRDMASWLHEYWSD